MSDYINSNSPLMDKENRIKPVVLVDENGNFVSQSNGTTVVKPENSTSSSVTPITLDGTDSQIISSADDTVKEVIIYNQSNKKVMVSFGSTCTNSLFSCILFPNDAVSTDGKYRGVITAKSETNGQQVNITKIL